MSTPYPPIRDPRTFPRRVLVVAPHADDESIGCGGTIAALAESAAFVRVLVLTDGARGGGVAEVTAPASSSASDLVARREAEARAAGAALGVAEHVFLRLEDGALGAQADLVQRVQREIEAFGPGLVMAPGPLELHADHRAACRATCAALARAKDCELFLYGVRGPQAPSVLVDVTRVFEKKKAALACYASQHARHDLVAHAEVADRALALAMAGRERSVERAEGFVQVDARSAHAWSQRALELEASARSVDAAKTACPRTTAVVSTWNKKGDLAENLDALRAQTLPFADVVVVDNASKDGTADLVRERYPEVRLIVMPHDRYGACETFNVGFASSRTELTAILDDDIVMPPDWLEKATARMSAEPPTTAIVSTQVTEPGMPEGYLKSARHNAERYMSTFRGCASLARTHALREAGGYDVRLFIYGNERDLTCRLLNLGYRVLQYPGCGVFHKTPFGIKMGKRSLYYHARNAWLSMLKHAPAKDLARMPWLVLTRVILRGSRKESGGEVTDATGTIGIGRSLRETPGAWWVLAKAALSVLANVPYCLKHRAPVRASDFELPLK